MALPPVVRIIIDRQLRFGNFQAVKLTGIRGVGIGHGAFVAVVAHATTGERNPAGGQQGRACFQVVATITETRAEDDPVLPGSIRVFFHTPKEAGEPVVGDDPGDELETIVLPVAVRVDAGGREWVPLAEIEDLPVVVEAVGGVASEVIGVGLLGICFWREGLEAALGPELRGGERGGA